MQFVIKRDSLLKSLTLAQGIIEKKKYTSYIVKCFIGSKKWKIIDNGY